MTTTEQINGHPITIKWEFKEIIEWHRHDYGDWRLEGKGSDGKMYSGTIDADDQHPESFHGLKVENIEEM